MSVKETTLSVPGGMTPAQFRQLERELAEWEAQIRQNASKFPARSYELGRAQIEAFMDLLGRGALFTDLPPAGGHGPTKRAAVEWQKRYTLHELDGALSKYVDEIRGAALYGLRGAVNPAQVAAWLHKATKDAGVNWRTVARTEMVRANAAGRLDAIEAMGISKVWAPRHAGACEDCRRLLEGKVFTIDEVKDKTNYGRKREDWVACIPCHAHCRHVFLPWLEDVFDAAQAEYRALDEAGLDDPTLNEMFDESGQVKPQYEQRLLEYMGRRGGPVAAKTFKDRFSPTAEVAKGYFDNPQRGLDPLVWTSQETLRPDVRERIVSWWRHAFTDTAPLWSHLYITGSSTGRAWAGKTPGDVDLQIVVNYDRLREQRPEYKPLSDPELHAALLIQIKAALRGTEVAPGLALDAFVRPQTTVPAFNASVRGKGQGVWDLERARWIVAPPAEPEAEDVDGGEILEGEGGALALAHPEWLRQARKLRDGIDTSLRDYGRTGATAHLKDLRQAYTFVHDLRAKEFATGKGADGLGNFLWRYLMERGRLEELKHVLAVVE